mgnify:FL=1
MKSLSHKFLINWINFWVFFFCVSVLSLSGHGGEAAIVLLLTSIYVFHYKNYSISNLNLDKDEKSFITVIIIFWMLNILNAIIQPSVIEFESISLILRAIDNPMRWILLLPLFFMFRSFKLDWKVLSIGLCTGVIISVSFAVYQIYFEGLTRARGGMNNVISFGELMVAADLILWVLMIYAWNNQKKILSIILLIVSLVAFYGSLLSSSRGAWIVYLLMILSYIIYSIKRGVSNKKYLLSKSVLLRIVLAIIIIYFTSLTSQYKQIKQQSIGTVSQISAGEYHKATSGRAPIFRTAIKIFQRYPSGVGTDNFRNGAKVIIIEDAITNKNLIVKNQDGEVIKGEDLLSLFDNINEHSYLQSFYENGNIRFTSRFRHAHNEWLNILAENGIFGFALFTLIFIFALKIFWRNLNSKNELVGIYSYSGILLILSFVIFGQTQSIFTNHAVLIFFIFFLYLFLGQISNINNIDKK